MRRFVIDASVAIKWFVPEVHSAAARRLIDSEIVLYAPDFLLVEIGNIAWKKARRGELTTEQVVAIASDLQAMRVEFHRSGDLLMPAVKLAIQLSHPVYDCLYLALGIAHDWIVVTADERFVATVAFTPFAPYVRFIEDAL